MRVRLFISLHNVVTAVALIGYYEDDGKLNYFNSSEAVRLA